MSRGLGKLERGILAALAEVKWPLTTPDLAFGTTPAKAAAIRRALGSLERKGLVIRVKPDFATAARWAWKLTADAEREERARKRRERRQQHEKEDAEFQGWQQQWEEIAAQARTPKEKTAKLAKLLGMLGSHHEGEILNAASQIEAERKRLNMTWPQLLGL